LIENSSKINLNLQKINKMHFYDNKNLIVDISTNVITFSDFYIGRIKNFALKTQIMHGR